MPAQAGIQEYLNFLVADVASGLLIGETRSRGPACGDATVEPIVSVATDPLRVFGVRSQRVPLPPCDAPRVRGNDESGVSQTFLDQPIPCDTRPSASLGSNQVDLVGMTPPASATAIKSSMRVG